MKNKKFKVSPEVMQRFAQHSDSKLKTISAVFIVFGILLTVIGLFVFIAFSESGHTFAGLFCFLVCLAVPTVVPIRYRQIIKQRANPEWIEYAKSNNLQSGLYEKDSYFSNGFRNYFKTTTVSGLPVAAGSKCKLILSDDGVCCDIGGAIAGGILFGAVGAAIGGRAKTKNVRTNTMYFSVVYKDKNEQIQNIILEPDALDVQALKNSIKKYKQANISNSEIEL